MFEQFRKNISSKIDISDESFSRIASVVKPAFIKRKGVFLQAGEVCNHLVYVRSGCLRYFSVDAKGNERVIQLALEDYWVSDLASFVSRKESQASIDALEDTHALLLHHKDLEVLYQELPLLDRFFRILFEKAYVSTLERLNNVYAETAEVRYNRLIKAHPSIIERVPLIHIASFLGIQPESLSRIRRKLAQ